MTPHDEQSVGVALSRAVTAGQHLMLHRIELALLDTRAYLAWAATRAMLFVVGGVFALGAVIAADLALVGGLTTRMSAPLAYLICAGIHLAVATALIAAGTHLRKAL